MMNYASAREHFVDVGEQMQRYIFEINTGWGQFLEFYSDLNNARKEQDETFVEKNYIGEEIVEPDEKGVSEDLFDHYDQNGFNNDNEDNLLHGSDSSLLQGRDRHNSLSASSKDMSNLLSELKKEINQEENDGKEVSGL